MANPIERLITKTSDGIYLILYVKPKSKENKLVIEGDELVFYTKEPAIKGRANTALIKKLSKLFSINSSNIKIIYGHKSKTKRIFIRGVKFEHVLEIIRKLSSHA